MLDQHSARIVVDAAHRAWSARDLSGLLDCYVDDLVYQCNVGPDGKLLVVSGKVELEAMLRPVLAVAESMSTIDDFRLDEGQGRARISCFVRHISTGLTLSGRYRQLITFRGSRICRMEEYHDAARLAAFWRLVAIESANENLMLFT